MKEDLNFADVEPTIRRDFQSKPAIKQEDVTLAMAAQVQGPCFLCDWSHFLRDCDQLSKAKHFLKAPPSSNRSRGRGRGHGSANATDSSNVTSATAYASRATEFAGKAKRSVDLQDFGGVEIKENIRGHGGREQGDPDLKTAVSRASHTVPRLCRAHLATISELAAIAQSDPDTSSSKDLDLKRYQRRADVHRRDSREGKALAHGARWAHSQQSARQ
ncbi:hypothetical protein DFH09DRAFT_1484466 [Mycena vulgaris]|nr:hypothetical protein DFH09DRAFT_1484466 [Mycena vulgaris]